MKMAQPNASDVRAWARENGLTVGERGHLPSEVVGQYNKGRRNRFENTNPMARAKTTAEA